jgi:hypothetical protein
VGCSLVILQFLGFSWFFWVRCLGFFVGCLLGVIQVSRFCRGGFLWVFVQIFSGQLWLSCVYLLCT